MGNFREIDDVPGRLYAVGDIHGCREELDVLLSHLIDVEKLTTDDHIIFIGDYVDRGPDSRGVIEALLKFSEAFPLAYFLKGNHEEMMLSFLGFGGTMGDSFLINGGAETLKSYGADIELSLDQIHEIIPPRHITFLMNLDRYIVFEEYIFVHAGLHPLRDVRAQLDKDIFWIRDEFIQNKHRFLKVVVFGHTPYQDVLVHMPYKIGLDTGLVYGNSLSCIEFKSQRLFQVRKGAPIATERPLSSVRT